MDSRSPIRSRTGFAGMTGETHTPTLVLPPQGGGNIRIEIAMTEGR